MSLGKHYTLEDYVESTGEARVKVASQNEIDTFVGDGFTPDPKYLYLHVIAMGSGEYYGPNKNGDYFPERALKLYHHTFEQNAKIFKEHNNKSDSPFYGKVVKSYYNPEMHRVELLLAVDKAKAPDIVTKVERGEVPEVSMGCRLPHDVCSICGNKAAKKSEYCEHINTQLKKILPDGRQVFMLNLQPTFFDISFVFRRADKIALMLKKVANEFGGTSHIVDIPEKLADIDKEIPAESVVKAFNEGVQRKLPELERVEGDLPTALLDLLALTKSIPDILTTCSAHGLPLKPKEFTRIVVIQHGLDPKQNFRPVLSGIENATKVSHVMGDYDFDIGNLVEPFLENRSSYGPHVVDRINKLASLTPGNDYTSEYSTLPAMYDNPKLNNRPPLRDPISPIALGLIMGAIYAGSRTNFNLGKAFSLLAANPKNVAAGVLGSIALSHLVKSPSTRSDIVKEAKMGFMSTIALPFVGAHFASAHFRNKYMKGEPLTSGETFIANNPDFLSVAAPLGMYAAKTLLTKKADTYVDEDLQKYADFADNLSLGAMSGLLFKGKGSSALGGAIEQTLDMTAINALIEKGMDSATQNTQKKVLPNSTSVNTKAKNTV